VANVAVAKALVSDMAKPTSNFFSLLELPLDFTVDQALLSHNYREAAKAVHPDRYASASDQDKRLAVQRSAELNQAYETLKSATQRALYLLNLQEPMDEEATVQDTEFFMQQIQWREELEDLSDSEDIAALEVFKKRLRQLRGELDIEFAAVWQDGSQRELAERLVRRMQFLDKVLYEVRQLEERLDD